MKKLSLRSGLLATTTICGAALSTMAGGALVATVATMLPATAQAQDYTSGAIVISVDDSSGAPVAGATVTLRSQAQGITKTLTTSASGTATATGLAPGEYDISVSAGGFDDYNGTASVIVSQSVTYTYALNTTGATQTVVVKGKRVRQDFTKTTAGLSVDLTTLTAQQPIGRSVQAVTLLAPTAVRTKTTTWDQPSLGGGSAAENAFYINGLNVTNPDTFIGGAEVPFDFYKTIDVQTSGYAAEFGRATGGVINATTKSGTNDFMFAVHGNFAPDSLRADAFVPDNTTNPPRFQHVDDNSITLESGGALIKDKLFLYGLVQLQDVESKFASTSGGYLETDKSDAPFYGLKADWYITPGQHLELTAFDTTSTQTQARTSYLCPTPSNAFKTCAPGPTGQGTGSASPEVFGTQAYGATKKTGGPSYVLKYTGAITDWFTISAAYGESKYANDFSSDAPDENYAIQYDAANGIFVRTTPNQFYSAATTVDDWERKFYRADADLRFEALGKHHIRFGIDHEDVSMEKTTKLPGAQPIRYYLLPDYSYGYIIYENLGGRVSGEASSYYIQDSWDVTSTLNLQLGLRNDDFKENNLSGEQFLDLTGNLAPRLGVSWKPSEDSAWRFTASYGQTFIPPAMNLGFRGKDLYFVEYFDMPAGGYVLDANGLPVDMGTPSNGAHGSSSTCPTVPGMASAPGNLGTGGVDSCAVYGNGTQEPADKKAAVGLKATRESEYTLGATFRANDLWNFGLTYVNRNLDRVSEDTDFASQINAYCLANSTAAELAAVPDACTYENEYHVWNVGDTVTLNTFEALPNGETTITLNNLGFEKPKRKFEALTLDFKRAFDGKWGLQGSYTWSRSTGNYEGTVLSLGSGTGQQDAGSTQLYDYIHLSDYADGTLINSRDHTFKVWGSYAVTDNLLVGANVTVISPGYLSCYGRYPDPTDPAYAYGSASHYCWNGTTYEPSPQGKGAKTDWTKNVDLSLRYTLPEQYALGGNLILRADIFNLFNNREITARNMTSDSTYQHANINFKKATAFNQQRYMRVGFDLTY